MKVIFSLIFFNLIFFCQAQRCSDVESSYISQQCCDNPNRMFDPTILWENKEIGMISLSGTQQSYQTTSMNDITTQAIPTAVFVFSNIILSTENALNSLEQSIADSIGRNSSDIVLIYIAPTLTVRIMYPESVNNINTDFDELYSATVNTTKSGLDQTTIIDLLNDEDMQGRRKLASSSVKNTGTFTACHGGLLEKEIFEIPENNASTLSEYPEKFIRKVNNFALKKTEYRQKSNPTASDQFCSIQFQWAGKSNNTGMTFGLSGPNDPPLMTVGSSSADLVQIVDPEENDNMLVVRLDGEYTFGIAMLSQQADDVFKSYSRETSNKKLYFYSVPANRRFRLSGIEKQNEDGSNKMLTSYFGETLNKVVCSKTLYTVGENKLDLLFGTGASKIFESFPATYDPDRDKFNEAMEASFEVFYNDSDVPEKTRNAMMKWNRECVLPDDFSIDKFA